jgi:hypothetical protein
VAATAAPAKEAAVLPLVARPSRVLTVSKNLIAKISS